MPLDLRHVQRPSEHPMHHLQRHERAISIEWRVRRCMPERRHVCGARRRSGDVHQLRVIMRDMLWRSQLRLPQLPNERYANV